MRECFRAIALVMVGAAFAGPAAAANLKVMNVGLADGSITSPSGINCGTTGTTCDATFATAVSVVLTAASTAVGTTFVGWHFDCSGSAATCTVTMSADRSVRAEFGLSTPITPITDFTPEGINNYLGAHSEVSTLGRFVNALPADFRQNWILMSRSESLQAGTAHGPRFLLPNATATSLFTFTMATNASYPGGHPNAIEYMQWDAAQKTFRFHEIVLALVGTEWPVPLWRIHISPNFTVRTVRSGVEEHRAKAALAEIGPHRPYCKPEWT